MRKKKGKPDEWAFKTLKYIMKHEHKKILLKHLQQVGIKIKNDVKIPDIMQDLKSILVSLNKLKQHYEK